MANGIPGFESALAQERSERNCAYLNRCENVCGQDVLQITPLLLCKLTEAQSPFICGGMFGYPHIAQFLTILSPLAPVADKTDLARRLRSLYEEINQFGVGQWDAEISTFLAMTFRDQPTGAPGSAPIASNVAWLEYRMCGEPWRWDRERTLNTPLRVIYQQIHCQEKEQGEAVINNLSHKAAGDWLKRLQAALDSGEITVDQIAEFQRQQVKLHSRN